MGQTTERVNTSSSGQEASGLSYETSVSADGRFVAFNSAASNLVPNDTNNAADIFVRDRLLGTTVRVSVDSNGSEGNDHSQNPFLSADGRLVAFRSRSDNLVNGDTNFATDIFVHNRIAGTTERVSMNSMGEEGNGHSLNPSLSADGRFVAFHSLASNLFDRDYNQSYDVFVHDRMAGTTQILSLHYLDGVAAGSSLYASVSGDGNWISFSSGAESLIPDDLNDRGDVFVASRTAGTVERISVGPNGEEANNTSGSINRISSNGRFVAFSSIASNLISWDSNGIQDVFVRDLSNGSTRIVSVNGNVQGNGTSDFPSISAEGRYIAFESEADNFVLGDGNQSNDIFVFDQLTVKLDRVNLGMGGLEANDDSFSPALSSSGHHLGFMSRADNMIPLDTNQIQDIFLRDRWDGAGGDTIVLTGPFASPTLSPLTLTWFAAPPNSTYWLAYSRSWDGSIISGHSFDLGSPYTVVDSNVNDNEGKGMYVSGPVPSAAMGLTLYFEVGAVDSNGKVFDSNVLGVTFY